MDSDQERIALENRLQNDEQALIAALNQLKRHEQVLTEQTHAINVQTQRQAALAATSARGPRPFVAGGPVLAPVGKACEFWDPVYASNNPFYSGADLFDRLQRDQLAVPDFANNEGYTPDGAVFPYWVFGLDDYLK